MKKIMCKKLKKEGEALDYLPYPGDIGKKIQESISKEAWEQWVSHQTCLLYTSPSPRDLSTSRMPSSA